MINIAANKKGRPVSDNSKDYMLRVRMDEDTLSKLDVVCEKLNKKRSECVRDLILDKANELEQ